MYMHIAQPKSHCPDNFSQSHAHKHALDNELSLLYHSSGHGFATYCASCITHSQFPLDSKEPIDTTKVESSVLPTKVRLLAHHTHPFASAYMCM